MTKKKIVNMDRKEGLYLKDTGTEKGRGVYCKYPIKEGEELETTPALILNEKEHNHAEKTILHNYVFTTGKISKRLMQKHKIKKLDDTSCVVMGIASYCNHDQHPNAEVVWEEKYGGLYYVLRATRNIPRNTEICTSYGDTWFDERK